jgi:F0F1-type ATP synthase assembly protein I
VAGPPQRRDDLVWYYTLAQIGIEMVAPLFVGLYLDWQFGTTPWLMLIGIVLGFVGGLYHLIVMLQRRGRPPGPGTSDPRENR